MVQAVPRHKGIAAGTHHGLEGQDHGFDLILAHLPGVATDSRPAMPNGLVPGITGEDRSTGDS